MVYIVPLNGCSCIIASSLTYCYYIAELSSIHSDEVDAISAESEASKSDLDTAHETEMSEMERKLSEKHAKDLQNIEMQNENRVEDLKLEYEVQSVKYIET